MGWEYLANRELSVHRLSADAMKYLRSIHPRIGSKTNGVTERVEEDKNNTSIIGRPVNVIGIYERQDAVDLQMK